MPLLLCLRDAKQTRIRTIVVRTTRALIRVGAAKHHVTNVWVTCDWQEGDNWPIVWLCPRPRQQCSAALLTARGLKFSLRVHTVSKEAGLPATLRDKIFISLNGRKFVTGMLFGCQIRASKGSKHAKVGRKTRCDRSCCVTQWPFLLHAHRKKKKKWSQSPLDLLEAILIGSFSPPSGVF